MALFKYFKKANCGNDSASVLEAKVAGDKEETCHGATELFASRWPLTSLYAGILSTPACLHRLSWDMLIATVPSHSVLFAGELTTHTLNVR